MHTQIIQRPKVVWNSGDRPWLLKTPLKVWSDRLSTYLTVPAGYLTDLASVPRWPLVYLSTGGYAALPSILHDWLYEVPGDITRKQADQVFLDLMRELNDPPNAITRRLMYLGVRLGGRRAWRRYREA